MSNFTADQILIWNDYRGDARTVSFCRDLNGGELAEVITDRGSQHVRIVDLSTPEVTDEEQHDMPMFGHDDGR